MLANCELIGLGPQIDTDTPVVEITSPTIGESVKNRVTIEGTCHDDNTVARVEISLRDSDGKTTPVGTVQKEQIVDGTSWSYDIETENHADSNYEVVAEVFDAAGRHSVATRSINIDNTPPVILLSKPASLSIGDVKTGIYGATVTLSGEILDDHDITALYVRAYDKEGNLIDLSNPVTIPNAEDERTWQKFENFDVQGGVNLTIAQYEPATTGLSEKEALLKDNYEKLFGVDIAENRSKTVVCQLEVACTDESGNISEFAYIKSDLNALVINQTKDIDASDLKSDKYRAILNGTCPEDSVFTRENQNNILDILHNPKNYALDADYASTGYLGYKGGKKITFSICPDNSPKYNVRGSWLD